MDDNIICIARQHAQNIPDQIAYTFLPVGEDENISINFAALDKKARAIAAYLQQQVQPGDRALLLYNPGLEFISGFLGCLYAGVVAVPVNMPNQNSGYLKRLEFIRVHSNAKIVLTSSESIQTQSDIPAILTDGIVMELSDLWEEPAWEAKQIAFLQYSSGTTGNPKAAVITHQNLVHNLEAMRCALSHTRHEIFISWLPIYHDMGLSCHLLESLYLGTKMVFMSPAAFVSKPLRWLNAITRYQGTVSFAPNFAYQLCVKKISPEDCQRLDLSTWQMAGNASEPVRAETLDAFSKFFSVCGFRREAFCPSYGLAENTVFALGGPRGRLPKVIIVDRKLFEEKNIIKREILESTSSKPLVASGKINADVEVKIVDEKTGLVCRSYEIGEIWLKSMSMASGYWNNPEATNETFHAHILGNEKDHYLRTGDLGFVDEEEYVYITGRLKEIIIIAGRNLHPHDIEESFAHCHPDLIFHAKACFSIDVQNEEKLVIIQEVRKEAKNYLEIFRRIHQRVFEEYALVPHDIVLISPKTLPKTTSGKTQRLKAKELYLSGKLESVSTWLMERDIQKISS